MSDQHQALLAGFCTLLEQDPPDVVSRGEAFLSSLLALKEPTTVRQLLPLFEDESGREELMWSMLHGIETLPPSEYAAEVLAGVGGLWAASREWAEIIMLRSIRDPQTLQAMGDRMAQAPQLDRDALRALLCLVKDENPDVADRAAELLALLGQGVG